MEVILSLPQRLLKGDKDTVKGMAFTAITQNQLLNTSDNGFLLNVHGLMQICYMICIHFYGCVSDKVHSTFLGKSLPSSKTIDR